MRMPPRAMSANRTWKPWKSRPTTKNTPNGRTFAPASARNRGFRRKHEATREGRNTFVRSTASTNFSAQRTTCASSPVEPVPAAASRRDRAGEPPPRPVDGSNFCRNTVKRSRTISGRSRSTCSTTAIG